ncbi:hypothetical protein WJX77_004013 [Trebouxia sp. C0004]
MLLLIGSLSQLEKMPVLMICSRATQIWQTHRRRLLRWKMSHVTAHCSSKSQAAGVTFIRTTTAASLGPSSCSSYL